MTPMTRGEFLEAVLKAVHGERIIYHIGLLYCDRQTGTSWETRYSGTIAATAQAAMRACEEGHVILVQRKLDNGIYQYIAQKRIPPRPIVWEGCYDPNRNRYVKFIKSSARGVDRTVVGKRKRGKEGLPAAANDNTPNRRPVQNAS